jgi:hypothetical protein
MIAAGVLLASHASAGLVQDEGASGRPILPAHLAETPASFWSVGVGLERFGAKLEAGDSLIGLAAMLRLRSFGPHALLMAEPRSSGYQKSRFLGGLGLRGYFPLLGTWASYGVGAHAEIRLEDHYWLAYATPLELGIQLWSKDSWDIELFAGARRAFAGALIDHYLIDPNGFDNDNARDSLDRRRHESWRGFLRVVFARRVD